MSNKKIPSHVAMGIVGLLALTLVVYIFSGLKNIEQTGDDIKVNRSQTKKIVENKCNIRAYQGQAVVSAWIDKGNGEVNVSEKDAESLPGQIEKGEIVRVTIVDLDEELKNKLENASPEKPEKIKLTGFTTKCEGSHLACLNYHDGIFSSYLKK